MSEPRKALITGGASGFGLAIAEAGAAAGWRVTIADIAEDRLNDAMKRNPGMGATRLDVTDPQSVRAAVSSAESLLGGIDTVVLSAGIIHVTPLAQVTEAQWDATLAVNLKGAFLVVQAAAETLKRSGRGRVIFLSSMSGKRGRPHLQAYVASKFGLIGLAESLAAELAPWQVTVNCICPSTSPTTGMGRMVSGAREGELPDDETLRETAALFPIGRYVEQSDVAAAALYLASDAAGMITGSSIELDGGRRFTLR
jgi:NAD(P)-dependent dehydrogenase (short-subunit alcohol dehydrogenase family)